VGQGEGIPFNRKKGLPLPVKNYLKCFVFIGLKENLSEQKRNIRILIQKSKISTGRIPNFLQGRWFIFLKILNQPLSLSKGSIILKFYTKILLHIKRQKSPS